MKFTFEQAVAHNEARRRGQDARFVAKAEQIARDWEAVTEHGVGAVPSWRAVLDAEGLGDLQVLNSMEMQALGRLNARLEASQPGFVVQSSNVERAA